MSSQKQSKRIRQWETEIESELYQLARFRHAIADAPSCWNIFAVRRWIKQLKAVR